MGFSKRKPYLKGDLGSEKDIRLKKSILDLFSGSVRYLKEGNVKESQFERPYSPGDYRTMHLRWPNPNWPSHGERPGPSVFGQGDRSKIHTIIFSDPSCHTSTANLGCGDSDSLSFSIWFTPPSELGGEWSWEVYIDGASPASLDDDITMSEVILSGERNHKARVTLSASEEAEEGIVVICGSASWGGSPLTKEIQVEVPDGANPFTTGFEALGRPGSPPSRPSTITQRFDINRLICCQEVAVEACCQGTITAWDLVNSAPVVNREASGTVYVTGSGTEIDWSISGTGFSIVGNGLSAEVSASSSACGIGEITATDCDSNSVTGYVRTNVGVWAGCATQYVGSYDCLTGLTCGGSRFYYTDPGHRISIPGDQTYLRINEAPGCDDSGGVALSEATTVCADGVTVSLLSADGYTGEGSSVLTCFGDGSTRKIVRNVSEYYFKCA